MSEMSFNQSFASGVSDGLGLAGAGRVALAAVTVVLSALLGLGALKPPAARPAHEAPPAEFSAGRAMEHLRVIAGKPHPSGSAEAAEVRGYLLNQLGALGLLAEVQQTKVVSNIVARLAGSGGGKTVLLVGHYDTVPHSPGAGDDGLAIAAMLETLRALKAGPPPRGDVIALFTDGEESGLLGARAFVYDHPWSKEVGLVMNFDARGDRGPVLMFETSERNEQLIEELAEAGPSPFASSMMRAAYKLLPNDTDFTVFRNAGYAGLNFAPINGFVFYHTPADSLENVSDRTLQQMGSSMLALAYHFGNSGVPRAGEGDAVYFNVPGAALVRYGEGRVMPLTAAVAVLFAAVVGWGWRKKALSPRGIATGFLNLLLSLVAVAVVAAIGSWVVYTLHGGAEVIAPGDTLPSDLYALGLVAFAVGAASAVYAGFGGVRAEELLAGGLAWWLILLVLTSLFLPGGSYLFAWPLLPALAALAARTGPWKFWKRSVGGAAVLLACAVPGVILFAPLIYLLLAALTLKAAPLVLLPVALLLGLILPHLYAATAAQRWLLPCASSVLGVLLLALAG
jgi:hypothetical protein